MNRRTRPARLSWNDISARAAEFARKWENASSESADKQTFYNEFFELFGVKRESVARYEESVARLGGPAGRIDLFWRGVLIVEHKSAGRGLDAAYEQAAGYFDALPEDDRPSHILVSNFQTFRLRNLRENRTVEFALADLPKHVEAFGFILGVERRVFQDQDPASIKAAALLGRLHDRLEANAYRGHDLERFLVRVAFCLFADNTGIFEPRDIFLEFVETRTREDGSDLGPMLARLFQTLDTPEAERSPGLDRDLAQFPYVNGDLFREMLRIPDFDRDMRDRLLDACRFNWSSISPAIFGALFQSVMNQEERRARGAHYTTEQNILRVIGPLFLDDLRGEFARLQARKDTHRRAELEKFRRRLGTMTFFDPACGCGNFLVVTYRELRRLEMEVIRALAPSDGAGGQRSLDVAWRSEVDVDQFHGIEILEFPVRVAETALWMMDHLMNVELSLEFGEAYTRLPLKTSPRIVHGDALETDWGELLPAERCSYVYGNPPFVGAKLQTPLQRTQIQREAGLGGSGGTLDYVAAWFIRASRYVGAGNARIGFVATNSITQGEQVGQLWPLLFGRGRLEIGFAHRTFAWGSDAPGKAHVHVVIVGLDRREAAPRDRRLFHADPDGEPEETVHGAISPYLIDAGGLTDPHLTVTEEHRPINGMRQLIIGSKPIDGGHYIFTGPERDDFLAEEPEAEPYLRPFVGAREYLQGGDRWILALHDASPGALAGLPLVRDRMAAVRAYRSDSRAASTRKLANAPRLYHVNVVPTGPFLVVPEVSSERREYVPIGWLEPPTVPSNRIKLLEGATLGEFALLTSAMHMAWLRQVGGRLESRYVYSIGIVYNAFPTPPGFAQGDADLESLESPARAVLDARAAHPGETLANLYDPDLMPPNLLKAHQKLDRAVDRLYRRRKFESERERVEHLFALYEKMRRPLTAEASGGRKVRRRRRTTSRARPTKTRPEKPGDPS